MLTLPEDLSLIWLTEEKLRESVRLPLSKSQQWCRSSSSPTYSLGYKFKTARVMFPNYKKQFNSVLQLTTLHRYALVLIATSAPFIQERSKGEIIENNRKVIN